VTYKDDVGAILLKQYGIVAGHDAVGSMAHHCGPGVKPDESLDFVSRRQNEVRSVTQVLSPLPCRREAYQYR
jgi:hypothetical protein